MKTLLIILILCLCSCSPYRKATDPVKMNYSVDGILCRDYQIYGETIILYDAGWYATVKSQRRVTEIKLVRGNHIIVKL